MFISPSYSSSLPSPEDEFDFELDLRVRTSVQCSLRPSPTSRQSSMLNSKSNYLLPPLSLAFAKSRPSSSLGSMLTSGEVRSRTRNRTLLPFLLFRSATSVGGAPRNDHILLHVRANADSPSRLAMTHMRHQNKGHESLEETLRMNVHLVLRVVVCLVCGWLAWPFDWCSRTDAGKSAKSEHFRQSIQVRTK